QQVLRRQVYAHDIAGAECMRACQPRRTRVVGKRPHAGSRASRAAGCRSQLDFDDSVWGRLAHDRVDRKAIRARAVTAAGDFCGGGTHSAERDVAIERTVCLGTSPMAVTFLPSSVSE